MLRHILSSRKFYFHAEIFRPGLGKNMLKNLFGQALIRIAAPRVACLQEDAIILYNTGE